ncbi:MAG: helix-turn-helix transcriptional regulator [Pseudomonadota bacterium]
MMVAHTTALTPREWQVLELIAQGHQLPGVAYELTISYCTARAHAHNIREKLHATTVAHAVFIAFVDTNSTFGV